jgi:hypothetical protein
MTFIPRQEPFDCEHCGRHVKPLAHGTYRNHCPHCLYSKHVDNDGPGDRASDCGGCMIPVTIEKRKGVFSIIHHCQSCKKEIWNKVAPDDNIVEFFLEKSYQHAG